MYEGNTNPYDGCYECKFACSQQCFDCINGICYGCIDTGWILNQINICTPQCRDGIVIEEYEEYEQCDDGNDIPYDGCYQCQFECPEGCIQCQSKLCQKCHPFYVLDVKTGNCFKQNNDNDDYQMGFQFSSLINDKFRCVENHVLIICVFTIVAMDLEIVNMKNAMMEIYMEEMAALLLSDREFILMYRLRELLKFMYVYQNS